MIDPVAKLYLSDDGDCVTAMLPDGGVWHVLTTPIHGIYTVYDNVELIVNGVEI